MCDYYRTRIKNPLKGRQTMLVIRCKLTRVFYMILTTGKDYDGQKMLSYNRRSEVIKSA